jgi:hypothetical protein
MLLQDGFVAMLDNGFLNFDLYYRCLQKQKESSKLLEKQLSPADHADLCFHEGTLCASELKNMGIWEYYAKKYLEAVKRIAEETAPSPQNGRIVYHDMLQEMRGNMEEEASNLKKPKN